MDTEKRYTVLCVDDEKNILNSLKRLLRKENYNILTASSGQEGLEILDEQKVHLIMSDQRMPEMNGTDFLERVKEKFPDIIRIILTGYTEVDAITGAINKGNIYKFFLKPWNDDTLKLEIRKALEQFELVEKNKELSGIISKQNEELKIVNDNLEKKVAERTRELELRNQALELSRVILDQLPFPVMGVDNEGVIAMANRKTVELSENNSQLNIGNSLNEIFNVEIEKEIINAITSALTLNIDSISLQEEHYNLELIPLSGRFKNKGAIVVLNKI